jgi:NTE family protein
LDATALVLQGGAALGAYEAGVACALVEPPGRPFEIVAGCSIGAVMAAILVGARAEPAQTLRDMWQRFSLPASRFVPAPFATGLSLMGNWNIYRPNPVYVTSPLVATHMYETGPLAAALDEWVDFRKLNRSSTELIVTAVDVRSGRLVEFSNRQRLSARHILASASLPPIFPMTTVGGRSYWDGGLIANTPLRPALNAIERRHQDGGDERWELIVVDIFAARARAPADLSEVFERTFELVFLGKFQHDMKLFETMNAQLDLIERIDRALPANSPLRRHKAFRKLRQHRKVDRLTLIRTARPDALGGPADFSLPAIERRLALGYADAKRALRARSRPRQR